MRCYAQLVAMIVVATAGEAAICKIAACDDGMKEPAMHSSTIPPNEAWSFKHVSSAPYYLDIKIRDPESGKIVKAVVENSDLADFLLFHTGRQTDAATARHFYERGFFDYMVNHYGQILDLNLNTFTQHVSRRRFQNEGIARRLIASFLYEQPLSLTDLGVRNEQELLTTYFNVAPHRYHLLKAEYIKQYNGNPAFIALLIHLGYAVGHEDIAPILFIFKPTQEK